MRTSWVFSPFGNNFVKTMLRLAKERLQFSSEPNQQTSARVKPTISVVSDQFGCPTSALDLVRALLALLTVQSLPYGILHFSNAGPVHWAQLAGAVFEQSNLPITVIPISSEDFAAAAPRLLRSSQLSHCSLRGYLCAADHPRAAPAHRFRQPASHRRPEA